MDILEYVKRMSDINGSVLLEEMASALFKDEDFIIFLQQLQLKEGENKEGNTIGTYSFLTQQIAAEENPLQPKIAGQPYNFEWTGGLFKGMFIGLDLSNGEVEITIDSKDSKIDLLEDKYPNLLGFQDENKTKITNLLQEKIIKYLNDV